MSGNKPTIQNKISPIIHGQLPQFVQSEHQLFSTFLKHYYEFMEAAEILSFSADLILLATGSYPPDTGFQKAIPHIEKLPGIEDGGFFQQKT